MSSLLSSQTRSIEMPERGSPVDPTLTDAAKTKHGCPRFKGHVLVVEDSRDSERILSYYLKQTGLTVTTAANGRIAVDKTSAFAFDLILMDMQMPVLDGYSATRLLRDQGYHQPIVALTAHTDRQDLERCLQVGCDACLSKPIERADLYGALELYLSPKVQAADQRRELAVGSIISRFANDEAIMAIVPEYVASLQGHWHKMTNALALQDYHRLASLAHQVRGGAGMYGFPMLGEVAGLIEDAIREQQNPELIEELATEFKGYLDRMQCGLTIR